MGVPTFWLERTDLAAIGLRRYHFESDGLDCAHGYHDALVYTDIVPATFDVHGYLEENREEDRSDPRWPTRCADCDYRFVEADQWQLWRQQVYRRTDTGELRVLHRAGSPEAPTAEPGACWDAWWLPFAKGPDGITLMVRCPGGDTWNVDSKASNCTRPDDHAHQCWVRHGDPRECRVTVDKDGDTCSAGAGSIQTSNWHGFLRGGQLVA